MENIDFKVLAAGLRKISEGFAVLADFTESLGNTADAVSMLIAEPEKPALPAKEKAKSISFEDVRGALAGKAAKGYKAEVKAILKSTARPASAVWRHTRSCSPTSWLTRRKSEMPGKHAICSASSSERWIQCPPSAKLNAAAGDTSSSYAQQGTDAHSKCEYLLRKALGQKAKDPTEDLTWYNQEMEDCCEAYRDFVMEQVEDARQSCKDPFVGVEQRLDYSRWVPEGAGTGDCVIVADDLLHIIDFKYGVGIPVSADHNSQLMCYALAALDTFGGLYDIQRIRLSIFQPRRENVNTWETTTDELLRWAEEILAPAAKLAYAGEGEFHAGEHCRFCRIRETCRARAEYNMELMRYAFEEPAELSNEEIANILPKIDSLTAWAADVKDYVLQQALNGAAFPGFKVVEGGANRKYTDEAAVASIVLDAGYDPYEKKVLGITAMTKTLGKKKFEELLSGYITKPRGKPVLAAESDARPEYTNVTNDDFDLED